MKTLFVGNSFTARNNVPGLVAQLAAVRGKKFEHGLISAGGASLRRHWNAGQAQEAIKSEDYDCVVLQEQSTLPVKSAARMHEAVRLFDAAIKSAGARTVLYMTWARKHAPQTQAAIADAYNTIGEELNALVVPVGTAWQKFLAEHDEPLLHDRDQSHPTPAGSYLAACVFVAILFRENPVGIETEVRGLAAKEQLLLQKTAWQVSKRQLR
jgi:hypothetical protein